MFKQAFFSFLPVFHMVGAMHMHSPSDSLVHLILIDHNFYILIHPVLNFLNSFPFLRILKHSSRHAIMPQM